jgi:acylphosphatase
MENQPQLQHLNLHIHGQVQGVFFRATARDQARRLGVAGFVRNEPDGSVYLEAEGTESALAAFAAWCRQGPPAALVEKVEATAGRLKHFDGFAVRYG